MRLAVAVVASLFVACASTPPQTADPAQKSGTVIGSAADLQPFAGLWRGTLDAVDDRLDGPIEFRLQAGSIMFTTSARTPQRILWLRVTDGKIAGAMETWFDPERKVDVYTTFEASLTDGTMHGVVREKTAARWSDVATFTATRVGD